MSQKAKIAALGRLCGIASEYWDNFGRRRRPSLATVKALLTAMSVPWEDPVRLDQELQRRRLKPFDRLLEPVQVITGPLGPKRVAVYPWTPTAKIPPGFEVQGEVVSDTGEKISFEAAVQPPLAPSSQAAEGGFRTRLMVSLPQGLDFGYNDLSLLIKAGPREESGKTRLIVAPAQVYLAAGLAPGNRVWGLNLPLYAIRSANNWGIGDLGDLLKVTAWASDMGAAFVGINPLHAPGPQPDADPSPYAPTSRLFLNF